MATNQPSQYYSYSKLENFRAVERKFRGIQAVLLLAMIVCFVFYLISLGLDIAKFKEEPEKLATTVVIDVVALLLLIIGIRAAAFESICLMVTFAIGICLVAVGHAVSFIFRHHGLTAANLTLALLLFLLAIIYLCYLCRMNRLKPPDQDEDTNGVRSEETVSSVAATESKPQSDYDLKRGFGSITKEVGDGLERVTEDVIERVKRDMGPLKSGVEADVERGVRQVKKEYGKLQSAPGEVEREFVAIKRHLLNEGQQSFDDLKGQIKKGYADVEREVGETVRREYTVVRREVTGDVNKMLGGRLRAGFGDLEKEFSGSVRSGLGDIEKEFGIVKREFGDDLEKVSGVIKREIVDIQRDDNGAITSYIERRLTDAGVEISSVKVEMGKAPMANFT